MTVFVCIDVTVACFEQFLISATLNSISIGYTNCHNHQSRGFSVSFVMCEQGLLKAQFECEIIIVQK